MQLEKILDTKVLKKTSKGVYKDYLVKWVGLLEVESPLMIELDIIKHGKTISNLTTHETWVLLYPKSMVQEHKVDKGSREWNLQF